MGKCLSGEMSSRGSVLRGSVRSGNCPFGEMSVGEVFGRETVLESNFQWGEKCHYASDIRFEWPQVKIILLSYYFVLGENNFL